MPKFRQIEPHHVEPAIEQLIAEQLAGLEALESSLEARLGAGQPIAYDDVFVPLEQLGAPLSYAWGLVSHEPTFLRAHSPTSQHRPAARNL